MKVLGTAIKEFSPHAVAMGEAFLPLLTRAMHGDAPTARITNLEASDVLDPDPDALGAAWFHSADDDGDGVVDSSPAHVPGTQVAAVAAAAGTRSSEDSPRGTTALDPVFGSFSSPRRDSDDFPTGDPSFDYAETWEPFNFMKPADFPCDLFAGLGGVRTSHIIQPE